VLIPKVSPDRRVGIVGKEILTLKHPPLESESPYKIDKLAKL
jgi:hypothetical protein